MRPRIALGFAVPSVLLAIAAATCMLLAVRLLRPVPIPAVRSRVLPESVTQLAHQQPASTSLPEAVLIQADPFRADRRSSELSDWQSEPVDSVDVPASPVVLLGTVILSDSRGFAMCRDASGITRLVRIGETFAGLTLRSLEQGLATFHSSSGDPVVVRVAKAGS